VFKQVRTLFFQCHVGTTDFGVLTDLLGFTKD
jgi:hypothetical protein